MKKLYNKALMYQYFYTGKWIILIGGVLFAFMCYVDIDTRLSYLKWSISSLTGDKIDSSTFEYILSIIGILVIANIAKTGFNKRNTQTFIVSGPYTKEEVKKNEMIYLLTILAILILIFLYVNLCVYIRDYEIISLSSNFMHSLCYDISRFLLIGVTFILYMSVIDMLFSNTIVTVAAMIGLPFLALGFISCLMSLGTICNVSFGIFSEVQLLMRAVGDFIEGGDTYNYYNYVVLTFLFTIVIGSIILYLLNKRITFNSVNKAFSFPLVQKVTLWSIAYTFSFLIVNNIFISYYYSVVIYGKGYEGIKGIIIFISILLISFLISIIVKRVIKRILRKII